MTQNEGFSPVFLDRSQRIQGYRYHLPHWRQESALYFVTFRLTDPGIADQIVSRQDG